MGTALLAFACCLSAWGKPVTPDRLNVSGASSVYQLGDDVVVVFSNYNNVGSVSLVRSDAQITARVLAVAGGGAGGLVHYADDSRGGPGGGGGGGFVETSGLTLNGGNTWKIYVGKGGIASTATIAGGYAGGDGGDSAITNDCDGTLTDVVWAHGGGGGGAFCAGRSGGSGGGGSQVASGSPMDGGAATPAGQGYAGASSKYNCVGGGGGGAGGEAPKLTKRKGSANGGAAKSSDITGTTVWYAGGGGGGQQAFAFSGVPGTTYYGGGTNEVALKGGAGDGGCKDTLGSAGVDGSGGGGGGSAGYTAGYIAYNGGSGVVVVRFSNFIGKEPNAIYGLALDDWQVGDTSSHVPTVTSVLSGNPQAVKYSYRKAGATEWSEAKLASQFTGPTEVGEYELRASLDETAEWYYCEAFSTFCVWVHPKDLFTDSVDIVLTNTASFAKAPVEVTFGEPSANVAGGYEPAGEYDLPGFTYLRAKGGDAIRFVLVHPDNLPTYTNPFKDLLLAHTNLVWGGSAGQTSVAKIMLPKWSSPVTVRMYWCLKSGASLETGNHPERVAGETQAAEYGLGMVNRDGTWIDYWKKFPTISKTSWELGEDPGVISKGSVASGSVTNWFHMLPDITTDLPCEPMPCDKTGSYEAIFDAAKTSSAYTPSELFGGRRTLTYDVRGHNTYTNLGGTVNGRILLGNDDNMPGNVISNQSYWLTATSREGQATGVWWTHEGTGSNPMGMEYLRKGVKHALFQAGPGYTNRIWTLDNVRFGNTFTKTLAYLSYQNYLPWTSTGVASSSPTAEFSQSEVSHLVMRNVTDAAITSQCFTNGVGAVYFDAVNGWTGEDPNHPGQDFKGWKPAELVVEFATNTFQNLPPTDENCRRDGYSDPFYWLTHDGETAYGHGSDMWHPAKLIVLEKAEGETEFTTIASRVESATLDIRSGGTKDAFYRIIADIGCYTNCRVRIRRVNSVARRYILEDQAAMVLVDNVIVSPPPMYAELETVGRYDPTRQGQETMGWACATSIPFPSMTDSEALGRARVKFHLTPGMTADVSKFIASARLNYRWRYLNQQFDPAKDETGADRWNTVTLDHRQVTKEGDILTSVTPFSLKGVEGDIEWFYDMTLNAPAYKYVDYSGLTFEKPTGEYLDERSNVTNRLVGVGEKLTEKGYDRLASGGTDWFLRLRQGQSDYEAMELEVKDVTSGAGLAGVYRMTLVDDHMWRVMVPVTNDNSVTVKFRFVGRNKQTGSPTNMVIGADCAYGPAKSGATATLPGNGSLVEGAEYVTMEVDHISNYIQFQMSDKFLTYAVSRAEYQNFNDWHDIAQKQAGMTQCFYVNTNSVDSVKMKKYPLDMGGWTLYSGSSSNWVENFYLADYSYEDYKHDVWVQDAKLPNQSTWTAKNINWVAERFVAKDNWDKESGMAMKLIGHQYGYVTIANHKTYPQGLEKLSLRTRVGQSMSFDDINYQFASVGNGDYIFFAPFTMSHNCKGGDNPGGMAPGASVSVVANYVPGVGCYEVRIERPYSEACDIVLYKWGYSGYSSQPIELCRDTAQAGKPWDLAQETSIEYSALFIACQSNEEGTETQITVGISNGGVKLSGSGLSPSQFNKTAFKGMIYTDSSSPHTYGAYGVASKDCPAEFVLPAHTEEYVKLADPGSSTTDGKGNKFKGDTISGIGSLTNSVGEEVAWINDRDDLPNQRKWKRTPARCELFTNTVVAADCYGFRCPDEIEQTLTVQISEKAMDTWTNYIDLVASGYDFTQQDVYFRMPGEYDVKLVTGTNAVDVVVDDLELTQWQAVDYEKIDSGSKRFIYTQGIVETNATAKRVELKFQPARAVDTKAVSLRSPVLDGLGKISFGYTDADTNAQIWVQVATNKVAVNLTGAGGYNFSTLEYKDGEAAEVPKWYTIRKYGPLTAGCDETLVEGAVDYGDKVIYLGWHDDENRPVEGCFRLYVPTNIVQEAAKRATDSEPEYRGSTDVDYGTIRIVSMSVSDEPGYSSRSWRGWNLRGIGDEDDTERRMNLWDMTLTDGDGYGLVCGLNNSIDTNGYAGIDGIYLRDAEDLELLKTSRPSIISPMFNYGTNTGHIVGSISFKARLYFGAPSNTCGRIIGYGSKTPLTDVRSAWTPIFTNEITSAVFSNFTWNVSGDSFYAVKLEVTDASTSLDEKAKDAAVDRIILDEIVVGERVKPSIGFVYARPFRNYLTSSEPVPDILSAAEQPLCGESWGVQTQLSLHQLTDEVDTAKGFEVYLSYYEGDSPWGFEQWKGIKPGAVTSIPLEQVGEASNLIFRTSADKPENLVTPSSDAGTVVQFMLKVVYHTRSGVEDSVLLEEWTQPEWFYGVDYNYDNGATDAEGNVIDASKFSAYTILDTISPGRAWINEVNYNDGDAKQNGGTLSVTNQFIEVCIPSGVDMTGWTLRLTDYMQRTWTMAKFGDKQTGTPSSKVSPNAVNGYEFFVFQSPKTEAAGGIHDQYGVMVADATWPSDNLGDIKLGKIPYNQPIQLELIRPSGIIEQQLVIEGTNTMSKWPSVAYLYSGSNLVQRLNDVDDSPIRFFAGVDTAFKTEVKPYASIGVIDGGLDESRTNWPGGATTWKSRMSFTPGHINEDQVIPEGWLLHPNGTNSWIYFIVSSPYVRQDIGGDTNASTVVVVTQGASTNVTYSIDHWYALTVTEDGETKVSGPEGSYVHTVTPSNTTMYVYATAEPQKKLAEQFGLDEDNPYSDSVFNWLKDKYGEYDSDDIRPAWWKGLSESDPKALMSLTEMYWLDIPPVPQSPEEEALNGGTNWWLRGGLMSPAFEDVEYVRGLTTYTNKRIRVKLYVTNECATVADARGCVWPPSCLQGLGGERSDTYSGNWTSVTFKVNGKLDLAQAKNFMPFRIFTFNADSFYPKGTLDEDGKLIEYQATIDILDPFQSPIGRNYGWDLHPGTEAFFRWAIETREFPYTTERLNADSTY